MAARFRRMLRHVRNLESFLKHSLIEYAVLFVELEITFIGKGRGFDTGRSADMLCEHQWRTQEFFWGGGGSTNSVRTERKGIWGRSPPPVRGSGGSCDLVQEISLRIVSFS